MMEKMKEKFKNLTKSIRSYPITFVMGCFVFICSFFINIEMLYSSEFSLSIKILKIMIFTTFVLLSFEISKTKFLPQKIYHFLILLLIPFVAYLEFQDFLRIDQYFVLLFCVVLINFLYFGLKNEHLPKILRHIVHIFFTTVLVCFIVFIGLNFFNILISFLFGFRGVADFLYRSFLFSIFVIGIPFFTSLLFNDRDNIPDTPKLFYHIFTKILLPLIIIYTVVISLYFVKSFITHELFEEPIAHLILWYSLFSSLVLFMIKDYPLPKFIKFLPLVILVLMIMLFQAIGIRISSFGFTISRYWVLLVGIWISFVLIHLFFRQKKYDSLVVLSLIALLLFASFGPMSAKEVSNRSQYKRYLALHSKELLTEEESESLNSIVSYLKEHSNYGIEDVDVKIEESYHSYHIPMENKKIDTTGYTSITQYSIFDGDVANEDITLHKNMLSFNHIHKTIDLHSELQEYFDRNDDLKLAEPIVISKEEIKLYIFTLEISDDTISYLNLYLLEK